MNRVLPKAGAFEVAVFDGATKAQAWYFRTLPVAFCKFQREVAPLMQQRNTAVVLFLKTCEAEGITLAEKATDDRNVTIYQKYYEILSA